MFVMLSPSGVTSGVTESVEKNIGNDSFQGVCVLPGTKESLSNEYKSWLDPVVGPTFAPLIHLLNLQLK